MIFWKRLIDEVSELSKNSLDLNSYCLSFYNKYFPSENINDIWNRYYNVNDIENLSLLFYQYFNEGNLEAVVGGFYNNKAKNIFVDYYTRVYRKNNLDDIFRSGHIFKFLSFHPENLLNKDEEKRVLTYLFLFYLPMVERGLLLYHPVNNDVIIIYPNITYNNTEMLLYLMEKEADFDRRRFLEENLNLNHKLISNYIETCMPFKIYKNLGSDWHKINFPREKILLLLKYGFSLNNFVEIRENNLYYTPVGLVNIINEIIIEHEKIKIDNVLNSIGNNNNRLQKI